MKLQALILAAGQGTRMKSTLPKVLHPLGGLPMLAYPVMRCHELGIKEPVIVVSKNYEPLKQALQTLGLKVKFAVQHPAKGTGHAVMMGLKAIKNADDVLILNGDSPLIQKNTLGDFVKNHQKQKNDLSIVTYAPPQSKPYGRIVRDSSGLIEKVVEAKDATPAQRKIRELNVGNYLVNFKFLKNALGKLKNNNAQKEYYLTDLIAMAAEHDLKVASFKLPNYREGDGINTQSELAEANKWMSSQKCQQLMNDGVRMINPESIVIDSNVKVAPGTFIMGPCYLLGQTSIGEDCVIEPGTFIQNSHVGAQTHIKAYSYIDSSEIGETVHIGPMAHLRPHTHLAKNSKVGNFVEIKKSIVGEGSKVNHLSYIGDATIGKGVNVGAGTITCNYDGKNKFKTVLEDGVFIGSDTQLVAPVKVGKGAFVGAGSTVTKDVPAYGLALSREPQKVITDWAKKKI